MKPTVSVHYPAEAFRRMMRELRRIGWKRGVSLIFSIVVPAWGAEPTCVTAQCHATILTKKDVHPPAESCDTCHEAAESQHPQPGKKTFKLVAPMKELCASCHSDKTGMAHMHGPAEAGDCVACHDPHQSDNPKLLVKNEDELCVDCHEDAEEFQKKPHVHAALGNGCTTCHDPHGSEHAKLLPEAGGGVCVTCHAEIGDKLAAPVVHAAVKSEKACVTCHSPHASDQDKLLLAPEKDTCLGCHKTIVPAGAATVHAPVKDGACAHCHDPHGGPNPRLLTASFPKQPYVPYTDQDYALCFSCHKREMLEYPDTSFATGFRDGERNLHFLHVNNKQKGRSCRLCHEVHASRGPMLIADTVPFGTWSLPIKFVKTETGGSCAPGCHKPQTYDRKKK